MSTDLARALPMDLDGLRRRFATATPRPDMIYGDQSARVDAAGLTRASVLVPVIARDGHLTLLLTQRTASLKSHAGQVCFPGGKSEPVDDSEEATALRETREEIGLDSRSIELLGRLSHYHTRTGYRVTPVVGIITPPFEIRPDGYEVEEVFEVPLAFVLDPANHQRHTREFEGRQVPYFAIPYGRHYIWGATAAMLVNFYRFLAGAA